VGIGAALSTTLAGYAIDHFGRSVAFFGLASVAVCGLALLWLLLPETRLPANRSLPASFRRLEFVIKRRRPRIRAFAAARQFASKFRKGRVRCGEMNISSEKAAI
jgi:MFS family permease